MVLNNITVPCVDTTFYAVYTINQYNVVFNANGGVGGGTIARNYNDVIALSSVISNPTREGYTFLGWGTTANGLVVSSYTMPAQDTTLYAVWSIKRDITITFNANGASGNAPVTLTNQTYGTTITLPGAGILTKTGYQFLGWSTTPNGLVVNMYSTTYTMPAQNTTLYAVWTLNQYYIFVDGYSSKNIRRNYNDTITLSSVIGYLYSGTHNFLGWSTTPNGAVISSYTIPAQDTTLYSIWSARTDLTVTFNGNGSTSGNAPSSLTNQTYGTLITLPSKGTLEKIGYTFAGWSSSSNSGACPCYILSVYTILYAVWSPTIQSITKGYVIKTDGSLWVTGANSYGQLGVGDTTDRSSFVRAISSGVSSVSPYDHFTYVIKTDGSLWVAGLNENGQLGVGNTTNRSSFVLAISSGVSSFVSNGYSTSVIKTDGSLWATGANSSGQLGVGDTTNRSSFVRAISSGVSSVVSNGYSIYVIKTDGSLWVTGANSSGQLGVGDTTNRSSFVRAISSGVSFVALNNSSTYVIKTDGSLWATGYNGNGELGLGDTTNRSSFTQVMSSGVSSVVSNGYQYTYVIKTDGSLWATGANSSGQLGVGDTTNRSIFTQAISSGVSSVILAYQYTYVIKTDGSLWATGANSSGQLGFGDTNNRSIFTQAISSGVSSVILAYQYTYVIKTDGSLWATGYNGYGQLGVGDTTHRSSFTQAISSGVSSFVSHGYSTYVIKTDGSLWATGDNGSGKLGLGDTTNRSSFTQAISSGVSSVNSYLYVIKIDGTAWNLSNNIFTQVPTL